MAATAMSLTGLSNVAQGFSGLNGLFSSSQQQEDVSAWVQAALTVTAQPPPQPPQPAPEPRKRGRPRKNASATSSSSRGKPPIQQLEELLAAKLKTLQLMQAENDLLSQRCRILEKVVEARNDHMKKLQEIEAGNADNALVSLFGLNAESLSKQSFRDMANKIRDLMAQVGGCLMQSAVTGDTQPVVSLISSLRETSKFLLLLRPDVVLVCGRNVNELCNSAEDIGVAPEAHWRQVVSQLQLNQDQVRSAWLLAELYNRWHASLLAERARLSELLSQVLSVTRYGKVFTHATAGRYTDAMLVDKINQNLISERCLIVLMADVLHNNILRHTQTAECILHSYPYAPDDVALLTAAAAMYAAPTPVPQLMAPSAQATLADVRSQLVSLGVDLPGPMPPGSATPSPTGSGTMIGHHTTEAAGLYGSGSNGLAQQGSGEQSHAPASQPLPLPASYSMPLLGTASAALPASAAAQVMRPTITTSIENPFNIEQPSSAALPAGHGHMARNLSSATFFSANGTVSSHNASLLSTTSSSTSGSDAPVTLASSTGWVPTGQQQAITTTTAATGGSPAKSPNSLAAAATSAWPNASGLGTASAATGAGEAMQLQLKVEPATHASTLATRVSYTAATQPMLGSQMSAAQPSVQPLLPQAMASHMHQLPVPASQQLEAAPSGDGSLWSMFDALRQEGEPLWPRRM